MELPVTMKVRPVSECIWEISPEEKPGMLVPARIYASETLLSGMDAGVFEQVTNVACLPGIVRASLCMPDGHWGYGFPIGGVAAFRADTGVISPGGIGFDINCGMRVLRTNLSEAEVRPRLAALVDALFAAVPTGVGGHGFVHLEAPAFREVMVEGAGWVARCRGPRRSGACGARRSCARCASGASSCARPRPPGSRRKRASPTRI